MLSLANGNCRCEVKRRACCSSGGARWPGWRPRTRFPTAAASLAAAVRGAAIWLIIHTPSFLTNENENCVRWLSQPEPVVCRTKCWPGTQVVARVIAASVHVPTAHVLCSTATARALVWRCLAFAGTCPTAGDQKGLTSPESFFLVSQVSSDHANHIHSHNAGASLTSLGSYGAPRDTTTPSITSHGCTEVQYSVRKK